MPKSRSKRKPGKPRLSGTGGRPGRARWFHGGAPGLRPGTILVPAATLGLGFHYHDPDAPYDPRWVYLASDEGVARAYASRYLDGFGRRPPGGVYEVRPLDEPRTDPDYRASPTTYRRCRRAEIIRVVVDGIQLSEAAQNRLEQAYTMWPDGVRVWDADGLINPSPEMTENGVPREWTAMLRPWLSLNRIDPHGRLRAVHDAVDSGDWRGVLEVVSAVDAHLPGRGGHRGPGRVPVPRLRRRVAGAARRGPPPARGAPRRTSDRAARRERRAVARTRHGCPRPGPGPVVLAAYRRGPNGMRMPVTVYVELVDSSSTELLCLEPCPA